MPWRERKIWQVYLVIQTHVSRVAPWPKTFEGHSTNRAIAPGRKLLTCMQGKTIEATIFEEVVASSALLLKLQASNPTSLTNLMNIFKQKYSTLIV